MDGVRIVKNYFIYVIWFFFRVVLFFGVEFFVVLDFYLKFVVNVVRWLVNVFFSCFFVEVIYVVVVKNILVKIKGG